MECKKLARITYIGAALLGASLAAHAQQTDNRAHSSRLAEGGGRPASVELGPRPQFLVNEMAESPLKRELMACLNDEPRRTDFSIGHRGAPLQFPEHTKESYEAGF